MLTIPRPSNRARGFVRRRVRDGCPSERVRFQCLQALWSCRSPEVIADVLQISPATVYRVRSRYLKEGVLGLLDRRSVRRPSKVTPAVMSALVRLLRRGPEFESTGRHHWTMEALRLEVRKRTGVDLHFTWIWQLVRRVGWVRKRTRPMVRRCNPRRRWQWARLVRVLWQIRPQEVLLFADEVDIDLNPKPGYAWVPRGTTAEVETPGRNQKWYLAGALNVDTGAFFYVEAANKRSGLFVALLDHLRKIYRYARRIHLVVDNYSIHKSRETIEAVGAIGRVCLHFLPGYSPEYNPVERIWENLHDAVTRNHPYQTMVQLMKAVRRHLDNLGRVCFKSPLPFEVRRHGLVLAESK